MQEGGDFGTVQRDTTLCHDTAAGNISVSMCSAVFTGWGGGGGKKGDC